MDCDEVLYFKGSRAGKKNTYANVPIYDMIDVRDLETVEGDVESRQIWSDN
jgi:hypothetical protein